MVGAKTYQLQVSPNGDWDNNILFDVDVKGTLYNRPNNINNGSYYWRVRAKDARSPANNGGWSLERQFTRNWPQSPNEITPLYTGGSTPIVGIPTLTWSPVPLASYYEVWIGDDPFFPANSYDICTTNRTTITPYQHLFGSAPVPGSCGYGASHGATYYWKIRAIDGTGNVIGIFSEQTPANTWRFIYIGDMVTLLTPANNATVQTPTLTWSAVDNVERYAVTIKNSVGAIVASTNTFATSWTPTDRPARVR